MSSTATMAHALVYLRVVSVVGRVKSRLLRLKQPKYLSGFLVGAAYLYLTYFRRSQPLRARNRAHSAPDIPPEALTFLPDLGALVLLVVLAANWLTPRTGSLAFSEAEIAFLFPAPVNRRMLVNYRLLGSQLSIMFTALIFTVVFGRSQGFGGNVWFHVIGWWLILATVNLHLTGTSFVYSKFLNRSITSGRRRAITLAVVCVVACALLVWAWSAMRLPRSSDFANARQFTSYAASQLHVGPLPWLLAIPKVLIAPYFASSGSAFLLALGPALIVLVAHYFWVVHTEVSFEEASIARAEKRAARIKAVQQGDWRGQASARKAKRPGFELRNEGRPEIAFLWKNLLSTSALFRPRAAIITLAIILIGCEWLVRQPELQPVRTFIGLMLGMQLVLALLFGPMIARQDLRADLANTDILKTYPLHGWQIVLGELLTPLTILCAIIWMDLFAEFLLLPMDKFASLDPSLRAGAALGLALIAPPFVAIQLLVLNAASVIFPAWMQSAGNRAERGIEVMGQRLIFVAGQLLIMAIAAVPAALSAAFVFVVAQWLAGVVTAAVLAVVVVVLLLSVEAWLGVLWLGSRFERFDLSAELRP